MGYKIIVYGLEGNTKGEVEMGSVFSDDNINLDLIHEYYLLQLANARHPIAHTKTRGEVSGSNKKLYRQKGTGYARAGEKRAPNRVGGGIVFGPRKEKRYDKQMNKKMRRKALIGLITLALKEGRMLGIDDGMRQLTTTKDVKRVLDKLSLSDEKLLVVVNNEDEGLKRGVRNIENKKYLVKEYLNPKDLLTYPKILVLESVVDYINSLNLK